ARQRGTRMLLPGAIGLEDHGDSVADLGEALHHVLDDPRAERARERAVVVATDARFGRVPAEQDRRAQLDPARSARIAWRRAWAQQHARGEVLDLTLAVDRGIRDDRDRLVEEVGEVRTRRRERGERAVPPQRAD